MMKRFATLAAFTVAALSFAGQANAAYTLTLDSLNPTTFTANGNRFDFAIAGASQTSLGNFAQSFNVINVAEPVTSGAGISSVTLSENFTIQDTTNPLLKVTGTLTGTFSINGATSDYSGSITNLSGTGFTVNPSSIKYALPTPGVPLGSPTQGNISFVVTPNAVVPEPTSVAILGLGLAGLSVVSFFRRRRHA